MFIFPGRTESTAVDSGTRGPFRQSDRILYFEFQVEKRAVPLPGSSAPRYPDELRKVGIEGVVVAEFVVDTSGRVDPTTFKVLSSTDPLFTETVRTGLANMKFSPAEIGGRKVKELIEMPFNFSLQEPIPNDTIRKR